MLDLKKNLLSYVTLILTVILAAGGTIMSYGKLTERVESMDERLARIERLLDNRTVAGK